MTSLTQHYEQDGLVARILGELSLAGYDVDALAPAQLSGVDEFHLGGALATAALMSDLELDDGAEVLDIGSGIGGAARQLAVGSSRHVTGVDLTADFVELATELSARSGCAENTSFMVGDATNLGFADESFDAITMFHVGMNVADKLALFREVARVLRPGGVFAVYDIMRIGDGEVTFPVPWSSSPAASHLATPAGYLAALSAAGLDAVEPVDRRPLVAEALAAAAATPPPLNLGHLMGDDWPSMFANLRAGLGAGIVAPTQIVAHRG